jgi:pimeloyl-ACP methyl ester carboxylesterase
VRSLLAVVTLLLVAYAGIAVAAATILTAPKRNFVATRTPASYNAPFEAVRFPARGGDVEIAGWLLPESQSEQAIILVHGKDSSRTNEFQGQFVDFASDLHARGFTVLMIDMRGHGQSGPARYAFGLNEKRDILGAVDWLISRGFQPGEIGLLGVSMGAASSIMATADEPAIGALVADCGYAAIAPLIEQEWTRTSGLPIWMLPPTQFAVRTLFGYDISASRPIDVIDEIAPRPVLLIHGTGDKLINVNNMAQLSQAAPNAETWAVANAEHAASYRTNPEVYLNRVSTFFETSLR